MVFERECFHPKLRMSLGDKRAVLRGALAVWMHDGRSLIGETYGVPIASALDDPDEEGYGDLLPFRRRAAIYVYSTAIRPRWQGKGLGKVLKAYFLGRTTQAGYRVAVGHAKEGASSALNEAFGARLGARHANWFGTGEPYRFYEMALR
jgi:GNAT superfamily N-acetyltransferase